MKDTMEQAASQITVDVDNVDRNPNSPKYTPIESILELREKNLTVEQVGKILGISKQAVSARLKRHQPVYQRIESLKKHRADVLTFKQSQLINALTEAEIKKMAPRDKVMAFGILYDKERLERGQSTQNISTFSRVVEAASTSDIPTVTLTDDCDTQEDNKDNDK